LCGIETALESGEPADLDLACRRLEVVYATAACFGGVPLLYMGDELGLRNDSSYLDDPELAGDNRWMHRPAMDWNTAARRSDAHTIEGRLFAMFQSLFADRAAVPALHGSSDVEVMTIDLPSLLGFVRHHPVAGRFAMLANFGRQAVVTDLAALGLDGWRVVRSCGVETTGGRVKMTSMGYVWLTTTD
jgi:amylosucrase